MRQIRLFILTGSIILAICIACAGNKEVNVAGTYISVKPDNSDRLGIMYVRGYFKYSYIQADKDTLYLNNDSTFVYVRGYYDEEFERSEGVWKYNSDHISLHYSDTLENSKTFKVSNDKIYCINHLIPCGTKKAKQFLDLYKKQ